MAAEILVGGMEAGGTKFVCAIGGGPGHRLKAKAVFPTGRTPDETLLAALRWFHAQQAVYGRLHAIGIASFGPLDLDEASATYGWITSTPKPGWAHYDLVGRVRQTLQVPVACDTDVNGAALAEWRWGAGQGCRHMAYVTIGTGIGVGAIVNGELLHGLMHPEMGHTFIPHDRQLDPYGGICPYHGDCWEGLASGPAIAERWGEPVERLPPDHPAWSLEAQYIAYGLANLICMLSPQRIVLGGGVAKGGRLGRTPLLALVRARVLAILNGYIQAPGVVAAIDRFIVPPGLGDEAGVCGGIALALQRLQALQRPAVDRRFDQR
jgi:fructokinase